MILSAIPVSMPIRHASADRQGRCLLLGTDEAVVLF